MPSSIASPREAIYPKILDAQALCTKKLDMFLRVHVADLCVSAPGFHANALGFCRRLDLMTDKELAFKRQLKRQALQLASMLPDDPNAAVKVLSYAYELIESFVRPNQCFCDARSTGGPLRLVTKDGLLARP